MERDPQTQPTHNIDPVQTAFAEAISRIELSYKENSARPDLDNRQLQGVTTTHANFLVEAISANPGVAVNLGDESYSLLSHYFKWNIPTIEQIDVIGGLVRSNIPDDMPHDPTWNQRKTDEVSFVKDKLSLDSWELTDEERERHARILDAQIGDFKDTSPKPETPKILRKRSYQNLEDAPGKRTSARREDFSPVNIAPPVLQRIKGRIKHTKGSFKELGKKEQAPALKGYQFTESEKNLFKDPGTLAAAKAKALALLDLDDKRRNVEARSFAAAAKSLGALGVRNQEDQRLFEIAESNVRAYNVHLQERELQRLDRVTDSARNIGHVLLYSDYLASLNKEDI